MTKNRKNWQPLLYAFLISVGLFLGIILKPAGKITAIIGGGKSKIGEILNIVKQSYVDKVNVDSLEESSINLMLNTLDPHSVYIPAKDISVANEQLEGNFEGIGIEFNIFKDTIMVVAALNGGPSQLLGIQPGDRIIAVDGKFVAGNGITNDKVFTLLRGPKGSVVKVKIYRPSMQKTILYEITRNTIPIYSVDASFMLDYKTGYIKISRFAENTHQEFISAIESLKKNGLENLVIDLRGNPGGYLSAACSLTDELLSNNKLIVYTQGRIKPRADILAENAGIFENGKLVVLIDEGSASASEILSGAVQDWDRGIVVGRRSFGKGLVQEPYELTDGSAIRLTVSRYYTPSGRCIQKDYKHTQNYEHDLINRYENGELEDATKAAIFDSTKFETKVLHRTVYGGGGIYPDVFVPLDTSYTSVFLANVIANALIGKYAYDYLDKHRNELSRKYVLKTFAENFEITNTEYANFVEFCVFQGIKQPNTYEQNKSMQMIKTQIKALMARQMWRDQGYYTVMQQNDFAIKAALTAFENYYGVLGKK